MSTKFWLKSSKRSHFGSQGCSEASRYYWQI